MLLPIEWISQSDVSVDIDNIQSILPLCQRVCSPSKTNGFKLHACVALSARQQREILHPDNNNHHENVTSSAERTRGTCS